MQSVILIYSYLGAVGILYNMLYFY